jgi:hypothetical protein
MENRNKQSHDAALYELSNVALSRAVKTIRDYKGRRIIIGGCVVWPNRKRGLVHESHDLEVAIQFGTFQSHNSIRIKPKPCMCIQIYNTSLEPLNDQSKE